MSIAWKGIYGEAFKGERALVVGGAGFIGSNLTRALLDLGAVVVVMDEKPWRYAAANLR